MSKKSKIVKIVIVVIVALFCLALTIALVPFINSLRTEEGQVQMENFIDSLGIFGPVIFVAAEIIQIILALIPGGPVEVIGGAAFGPVKGLILCEIGIFIATMIIYNLVKKFGKPVVNTFVSEENFKKFKFLHDEKKLELVVFAFLVIPGTPKDVITYIASLTDIKPVRFYVIATVARIPALTLCTLFGGSLSERNYTLAIVVVVITAVVGITGILLNNKITTRRREKVAARKALEQQGKNPDAGEEE
ncbi:MAG: TVP38/TMEM64 family protein [Porcipelethomonas sp.]